MDEIVLAGRRPRSYPILSLLPAICILLPALASAQAPTNLNLLQPLAEDRAKVDVVTGDARQFVRGRLLGVTPSTLVVDGRNGSTEIPAAEVREVWSPGGPRYRKPLVVGTLVGLGLGLMTKAGQGDCRDPKSLCATDGPFKGTDVAIVTAAGSATGLAWAWLKRRPRHLVYLSPDAMAGMTPARDPAGLAPVAARPDWLALEAIQGNTVEIAQRGGGSTLKGTLISITPAAIQLLVDGEPNVVRQQEVTKVWSGTRPGWWRVAAGGLYYGTFWGGAIAGLACHPGRDGWGRCENTAFGATIGAFATIAALAVAAQRHRALAYDASRAAQNPSSTLLIQPILTPRAVGLRGAVVF